MRRADIRADARARRADARARRAAAARAWTLGALAALAAILSVAAMEREARGPVAAERLTLAGAPATLWRPAGAASPPLVLVAHGYGGSRQMMAPLSIALARSGLAALAFDFPGHGRHPLPMDADVTSLEGTTAQLVEQTIAVAEAARALPGLSAPTALLGHSMATDVVIRAAPALGTGTVVAISMYSEAVTAEAPSRLLIVSGAAEGRLRGNAVDALRLVDPAADEGMTARAGAVERRAVAAPGAEHVGVLYSAATMREARAWIAAPSGGAAAPLPVRGPWTAALLAALLALAWPLSRLAGPAPAARDVAPPGAGLALLAVALPAAAAIGAAALVPDGALGLSALGQVAAFLGAWGAVQSAILWRAGRRLAAPGWRAGALYLGWALLFALALDRYGAAFVPTGPRLPALALVLLGTLPFLAGDALLTRGMAWPLRVLVRAVPLAALLAAMAVAPRMGIAFTVLPVAALFWIVYGTAAAPFRHSGGAAIPAALALVLAWAIAASTPLVTAAG